MSNRMRAGFYSNILCAMLVLVFTTALANVSSVNAQTEDTFSDDPVKLFERGQTAHSRGDLRKALELYEEAIKVRPEFPEAEFQRGTVLIALGQLPEAESAFRRAIELRKKWALPNAALGALLLRLTRDEEAETFLREAIKLDKNNNLALRMLADRRLRAGDVKEALELSRRATEDADAPVAAWFVRALAERQAGDKTAAITSLTRVLEAEPQNAPALIERAEVFLSNAETERALSDLAAVEPLIKDDKVLASRVAAAYQLAGKVESAQRIVAAAGVIKGSGVNAKGVIGTPEEIEAVNSSEPDIARKAAEALLVKNPNNAMLLARLGDAYRKIDPPRSMEHYRKALEIEPTNADYATGYSSALVQARRFADAVIVLRKVINIAPGNYAAHANLATALYSLKYYREAMAEYKWLLDAKPDLTIAHYFIATSYDNLGEYEQALPAYETFIARADPATNQLEIEKVKLRLPLLRRQIQLGQGVKPKAAQKQKQ